MPLNARLHLRAPLIAALIVTGASAAGQKAKAPHPDLQGIWSRSTLTPLERPKEVADKAFVNQQDVAAYEKQLIARFEEDEGELEQKTTGEPTEIWADLGGLVPTRRTSLIVDPADGLAPLKPDVRKA